MIEAFTSQLELWNEKAKKKRFCRKKHKEHKDCKCYRGECSHGIYAGILFTLISTFYVSFEPRLGLRLLLHRSATYVGRKAVLLHQCCICCTCTGKSGIWYREVVKISRTEAAALDKQVNEARNKRNGTPGRLTKMTKTVIKYRKKFYKVTPELESDKDFYTYTGSGHRTQDDSVNNYGPKVQYIG